MAGRELEEAVARIQQMMDPSSTVTRNEKLVDRVGLEREYDVVIRGVFGGRPILGVMECKDHSRKKGPQEVEAFATKAGNLGANFKIMVSRKGFTKKGLKVAKFHHIGCLSLLPDRPELIGFAIGQYWYGVAKMWADARLIVMFEAGHPVVAGFSSRNVLWQGRPVVDWFRRELCTTYADEIQEKEFTLQVNFDQARNLEIEGKKYVVKGLACVAKRVCRNKRKWVSWTGEGFYDWHDKSVAIPAGGRLVGSPVETDLTQWEDYDGPIPDIGSVEHRSQIRVIMYEVQEWDDSKEVVDLRGL